MQKTATVKLNKKEASLVQDKLESVGWEAEIDKNQYVNWRMVNLSGAIAVMYTSGKLVLQGEASIIENTLTELGNNSISSTNKIKGQEFKPSEIIGCDEAGKGEFFGPLVLGVCYIPEDRVSEVKSMGVQDSKRLSDDKILSIAETLEGKVLYELDVLEPTKLNAMWGETRNLSEVMAQRYSVTIKRLVDELEGTDFTCKAIVIDQFTKISTRVENALKEVGICPSETGLKCIQIPRGEAHLSVAAASILARAAYLNKMSEYEEEFDIGIPRGYDGVAAFSRKFIAEYSEDELQKLAKTFFKTYKELNL
ncbi:ribonuclease HIII [Candidatus Dojkabacteria bacterium]|nr:ribonuclease HIII [Candidatus Dojkabacteria bacterium]